LKADKTAAITVGRCAVSLILDMASGREYGHDELSCRSEPIAKASPSAPAEGLEYAELNLATLDTPPSARDSAGNMHGIDVDALIERMER